MSRISIFLLLCTAATAQVTASYELESTRVTAHEPIILSFTITNNSAADVNADLGLNSKQGFVLWLIRPDGSLLNAIHRPTGALDFLGKISIEPGRTFTQKLVLNEWFEFSQLGSYKVHAFLQNPIRTKDDTILKATGEFEARVEVGPANPESVITRLCGTSSASI